MQLYNNEANDDNQPVEITLEDLKTLRDDCKHLIDNAEAASRLMKNEDFKKVVLESYFEGEPKRLGSLIASGRLPEGSLQGAFEDLKSIGNFVTFINETINKGEIVRDELACAEEAYNEAVDSK